MTTQLEKTFRHVFGEVGAAQGEIVATLAEVEAYVRKLLEERAEMLEALKGFAAFYREFLGPGEDLDRTREYHVALAVIAKAEGNS